MRNGETYSKQISPLCPDFIGAPVEMTARSIQSAARVGNELPTIQTDDQLCGSEASGRVHRSALLDVFCLRDLNQFPADN